MSNKQADVGKIAREVLKIVRQKGGDVSYDDLRSVIGLGEAKIPVILASLELARRYLLDSDQKLSKLATKKSHLCWYSLMSR